MATQCLTEMQSLFDWPSWPHRASASFMDRPRYRSSMSSFTQVASSGETPINYLERKVLKPIGLGPQEYKRDRAGNPLLAAGFRLTAEQWSRMAG